MRLNPATRLRVPALRERPEDLPDLVRFAFLDALRAEQLRPLVRAYLARYPTPDDFVEENDAVVFGKPQASRARRDAFTVFLSKAALRRLVAHPWPGNQRELKLLAFNAIVHALAQHLDAESAPRERAPAVLAIPDALIESLLGNPERRPARPFLPTATAVNELGRRVEVTLKSGHSFADISADVERQYLVALFEAMEGDLDRMAAELFGAGASRRKVHLRMNQLGLRLRELRGARA
jgi:DNA-binding NtrC family response regulator